MKYLTLFILFCLSFTLSFSQDSTFIKVHFLYGSKPLKTYKATEKKWFGGVLGGHVGIEGDSSKIINFSHIGRFHLFAKKKNRHSKFSEHPQNKFYSIFGGNPDSVKKTIVYIPVTKEQKQKFDSIAFCYLKQTPYDYALFGMRCGASTYEILGQLNILPNYSYKKTYKKIFFPKKLRTRLLKKASENGWTILRQEGSTRRSWEKD